MSDAERQKWNQRYAEHGTTAPQPSPWLLTLDSRLPREGRTLDVAGGNGRHALWLARRGLAVTLCDISTTGIALAMEAARQEGLALTPLAVDLAETGLPAGPWDLILCFHYLERDVYRAFSAGLSPGGTLVVVHPTLKNLERHPRPGRPFLLDEGELPTLLTGLTLLHSEEGWLSEGRHEARIIARRES